MSACGVEVKFVYKFILQKNPKKPKALSWCYIKVTGIGTDSGLSLFAPCEQSRAEQRKLLVRMKTA